MTDINIRAMEKTDLPAVVRIENVCQSHPWSLLQFLDGFVAGHQGWLACMDFEGAELIVGFAVINKVVNESTLLNICIRPACQKQGYGRQLMEHLLQQATMDKISNVFLEVRASNQGAIHLYESLGFQQISVRRDYYPAVIGREDGLVYAPTDRHYL